MAVVASFVVVSTDGFANENPVKAAVGVGATGFAIGKLKAGFDGLVENAPALVAVVAAVEVAIELLVVDTGFTEKAVTVAAATGALTEASDDLNEKPVKVEEVVARGFTAAGAAGVASVCAFAGLSVTLAKGFGFTDSAAGREVVEGGGTTDSCGLRLTPTNGLVGFKCSG